MELDCKTGVGPDQPPMPCNERPVPLRTEVKGGNIKEVKAGEVLIREGATDRIAYLVVMGSFKVVKEVQGHTMEIARLHPGDWVGEIALMQHSVRMASVVALEPSIVACVDEPWLQALTPDTQLPVYKKLSELAAQRINEAYQALLESQRRLALELAEAARYVRSLIPEPIAEGPVTTDWRFIPSAQLGGDALGYLWLDEERFAMYLLDVCGHGVGAALLSVAVMNVLRNRTLPQADFSDPGSVLEALNETFPMERHNNMFFSIWYGVYHLPSRRLRFASGGHPPAVLVRGRETGAPAVERLEAQGMCVGCLPAQSYTTSECGIATADVLCVFSDGVYEIAKAGGGVWTLSEFIECLRTPAEAGVADLDGLLEHVRGMQRPGVLEDDCTLLQVMFW